MASCSRHIWDGEFFLLLTAAGMEEVKQEVDDISLEFVKTLIQKDIGEDEIEVKNFRTERATEAGDNFSTVIYRITANYNKDPKIEKTCEAVYIGKFLPVQPKQRELVQQIMTFDREVVVYNDLIPAMVNLQKEKLGRDSILVPNVPQCIYANGKSTPIAAVIMEDLFRKGFRLADKYQGLQPDEVRLLMEAYGRYHGLGVFVDRHSDFSSRPIFRDNPFETIPEFHDMMRSCLNSVCKVLEEIPGQEENARKMKDYVVKVDGGRERLFEFIGRKGKLLTFLHGDCWCNNMMFRYDPDTGAPVEIKIFDLQIVAYGNPCRDLMHVFYSSTSKETRKQKSAFLKLYHDTLISTTNNLGVVLSYSYEDFLKEIEDHEEFGFLVAMFIIPVILAEKEDIPDYTKTDLDVDEFIRLREQQLFTRGSSVIKQRLVDIVERMVEIGVF
ncbi:unnamed protein product [Darwinula stevensoni]|uniref:CHK kinase-like domain-containing protein n=1 Tax=Darwinula stevensoni TaxID=69355 RepID=A0A7R8XJU9_9CRUS|nr:unnamed protein product [Darwinula stevensoni]CAG0895146.1 unnamed protein product [Darwinula stevensoni]